MVSVTNIWQHRNIISPNEGPGKYIYNLWYRLVEKNLKLNNLEHIDIF